VTKFLIIFFFAAHCQNGEVPGGFWKCEDLQADVDDGGIDEDDDSDDWSILTGVGRLIEPRHVACHCSRIWPSAFLHLEAVFLSVALCRITRSHRCGNGILAKIYMY